MNQRKIFEFFFYIVPQLTVVDSKNNQSQNVCMPNSFFVKFGNNIKNLRLKKGLSQEALGFDTGISGAFVGMIERAEKDISLSKVYKLAKALDVSIKDLF